MMDYYKTIIDEFLELGPDGMPVFKKPHRKKPAGYPALRNDSSGARGGLTGSINSKRLSCSVAVWYLTTGKLPDGKISFKDGNNQNCKFSNLVVVGAGIQQDCRSGQKLWVFKPQNYGARVFSSRNLREVQLFRAGFKAAQGGSDDRL